MADLLPSEIETKAAFPSSAIVLLRTTQQHHIQLSQMADQKAQVLMGATFVVFTIVVSQAAAKGLTLPFLVLGLVAFVAAVLCVLSLMPTTRLMRGPSANLLFFGSFVDLSEAEFKSRMDTILRDEEAISDIALRGIYQMGVVLHFKKYRYLAAAYRVFLLGLVVTFALFISRGGAINL